MGQSKPITGLSAAECAFLRSVLTSEIVRLLHAKRWTVTEPMSARMKQLAAFKERIAACQEWKKRLKDVK